MKGLLSRIFGGRLQIVLIASFSLVATLTVGLNAIVVSQLIEDYLAEAKDESVARDMALAEAFYQLKSEEIQAVGYRMVRDPRVVENVSGIVHAGMGLPVLVGSYIGVVLLAIEYAERTRLRGQGAIAYGDAVGWLACFYAREPGGELPAMGGVGIMQFYAGLCGVDIGLGNLRRIGAGMRNDKGL